MWTVLLMVFVTRQMNGFINGAALNEESKVKRQDDQTVTKMFRVGGKSYVLGLEAKTWQEARAACKNLGGDLASSISYKEFDGIVAAAKASKTKDNPKNKWAFCVWVGAYRNKGNTGNNGWKWITGEPLSSKYAKWYAHGVDSDRYAFIETHAGDLRSWTADYKLSFVCETL